MINCEAKEDWMTTEQRVNEEAADFELCQELRGIPPMITVGAMALVIGKLLGTASDDEAHSQRGAEYLISVIAMTAANHLAGKIKH
jgi:hypothetical protein